MFAIGSGPASLNLTLVSAALAAPASTGTVAAGSITVTSGTPVGLTLDQGSTFSTLSNITVNIAGSSSAQAILVTNGSTLYVGAGPINTLGDSVSVGPLQQIICNSGAKIICDGAINARFAGSSNAATSGVINLTSGTLIVIGILTIGGTGLGGAANGLLMTLGSYALIAVGLSSIGNAAAQITLSDSQLDSAGTIAANNLVTTTFASPFSQPAVSAQTGAITVGATTGFSVGQTVTILNGGTYTVFAIGSGPASLNLTLVTAAAAAPASTGTVAAGSITVTSGTATGLTLDQGSRLNAIQGNSAIGVAIGSSGSAQAILVTNGSTLFAGSTSFSITAQGDGISAGPAQQIVASAGSKIICQGPITAGLATGSSGGQGCVNLASSQLYVSNLAIGGATTGGKSNGLIMTAGSYALIAVGISSTGNAAAQITLSDSRLDNQSGVTASNLVTTTFASSFAQPALSAQTPAITVSSTSGFSVGQTVTILNGGTYTVFSIAAGPPRLTLTLNTAAAAAPASTGTVAAGSITVTSGTPIGLTLDQGSQFSTSSNITANIAGTSSTQAILVTNGSTLYAGGAISTLGDSVSAGPQQQIIINNGAKMIAESNVTATLANSATATFGVVNLATGTLISNGVLSIGGTALGGASNGLIMTNSSYVQTVVGITSTGNAAAQITMTDSRLDTQSTVNANNLVTTTFGSTFTQPSVSSQTPSIAVASTSGFSVGQTVNIKNGGVYTVFSVTPTTTLVLTLVTAVGTIVGGTVPAGSITVTSGTPTGITLDQGSVFNSTFFSVNANVAGSNSAQAILLSAGSALYAGSINAQGDNVSVNALQGIVASEGSRIVSRGLTTVKFATSNNVNSGCINIASSYFYAGQAFTITGGASNGLIASLNSQIVVVVTNGISSTNNAQSGVSLSGGTYLFAGTGLSCTGNGAWGLIAASDSVIESLGNNSFITNTTGGISLSGSSFATQGACDVSNATTTGSSVGLTLDQNSLYSGQITANIASIGSAQAILVTNGSMLYSANAITAQGNNVALNALQGIVVSNGSKFICEGQVTVKFAASNNTTFGGVNVSGSYFYAGQGFTITGGASNGLIATANSQIVVVSVNVLSSTNNAQSGVSLSGGTYLYTGTGITCTGNAAWGLIATANSVIESVGNNSLITNTTGGASLTTSKFITQGTTDVSNATTSGSAVGLTVDQNGFFANTGGAGGLTANIASVASAQAILASNGSTIYVNGVTTAQGDNSTLNAIQCIVASGGSKIICAGAITVKLAAGTTAASQGCINLASSQLYALSTLTITSGKANGLIMSGGSYAEFSGALSSTGNSANQIALSDSRIDALSTVTVNSSVASSTGLLVDQSSACVLASTLAANISATGGAFAVSVNNGSTLYVGDTSGAAIQAVGNNSSTAASTSQQILVQNAGRLICEGTIAAAFANAATANNAGIAVLTGGYVFAGALSSISNARNGIFVSGSNVSCAGALTVTSNTLNGISVAGGSIIEVGGALSATLNSAAAITLTASQLLCQGAVTASNTTASGTATGLSLDQNSVFSSTTTLTAAVGSSSAAFAIQATNGSTVYVGGAISAIGNASVGPAQQIILAGKSTLICESTITASFAQSATTTLGNINLSAGSYLFSSSAVTASSGLACGIVLTGNSTFDSASGTVTAATNAASNLSLTSSYFMAAAVSFIGSTAANGIVATAGSTLAISGAITATGNKTNGVSLTASQLVTQGAVDVSGAVASAVGLMLDQGSLFATSSTLTANISSATGAQAILVTNNSILYVGDTTATALAAKGNTTTTGPLNQIVVSNAGRIICEGTIATQFTGATNSTRAGIVLTGGSIYANAISTTGGTSNGILATAGSSISTGVITATGNALIGISLTASQLVATGAIDVSNSTGGSTANGVLLDQGSVFTGSSTLTANIVSASSTYAITAQNGSTLYVGSTLNANGNTTSTGPSQGIIVATSSRLICEGAITAQFAAVNNIAISGTSSIYVAGAVTASSATGSGVGIAVSSASFLSAGSTVAASSCGGGGITATGGSILDLANTVTTTGNTGNGIALTSSQMFTGSTVTATGNSGIGISLSSAQLSGAGSNVDVSNAAGTGTARGLFLDVESEVLIGGSLTANIASGSSSNAILVNNDSSLYVSAAITATGNGSTTGPGTQINAAAGSQIVCESTVSAQFGNTNINIQTGSHFYCQGAITASNATSSGTGIIVSGASYLSASNSVTASSCGNGITATGASVLDLTNIVTTTGNTINGINLTSSQMFTGSTVTATGNSGIGISLSSAQLSGAGSNIDVSNAAGTGTARGLLMDVGSTILIGGSLTANIASASSGFAILVNNDSSLYVSAAITATGNTTTTGPGTQINAATGSQIVCESTVSAQFGNTNISLQTGSHFYCQGAITASNATGGGTGIIVSGASYLLASSTVTASSCGGGISATGGSVIEMQNIVTASSNSGVAVNLANSQLFVQGAAIMATNSQALVLANGSSASFNSTIAASQSTTTAEISVSSGSILTVAGTITLSRTTTTIPAGIALVSARAILVGVAAASGSGLYQNAISATKRSSLVVVGSSNVLSINSATTPLDVILIDNSDAEISGITVDSSGASNAGISLINNATGKIVSVVCTNGGNGIAIARMSRAELQTIAGSTNSNFGVQLLAGGAASYLTSGMTVTGTNGNAKVGAQNAATWTNVNTGQAQYVNDWSFTPAAGAMTTTTVIQNCSLTPHS